MKRRTKRKLKKILSKNLILIAFVGIFLSIFLIGTAYSISQSDFTLKGKAHIGEFLVDTGDICSSYITIGAINENTWTPGSNVTIKVENKSDEKMSNIIFVFDKSDSDAVIDHVSWAKTELKGNKYYITVYEWYMVLALGHSYLDAGESIEMTIDIEGSLSLTELRKRTSLSNCGQDIDTDDTTTKKLTNGPAEMNLNVLENELTITAENTGFNSWTNTYDYTFTITNPYEYAIDSYRVVVAYDESLTLSNSFWEWTNNITVDDENKVVTATYTGTNLKAGGTTTLHASFTRNGGERVQYSWGQGEYIQESIPVYPLAAGIIKE